MKIAQISARDAKAIADYVVATQGDAIRATGNRRSVTSTRITFQYDDQTRTASVWSSYTYEVLRELPAKYQSLFA